MAAKQAVQNPGKSQPVNEVREIMWNNAIWLILFVCAKINMFILWLYLQYLQSADIFKQWENNIKSWYLTKQRLRDSTVRSQSARSLAPPFFPFVAGFTKFTCNENLQSFNSIDSVRQIWCRQTFCCSSTMGPREGLKTITHHRLWLFDDIYTWFYKWLSRKCFWKLNVLLTSIKIFMKSSHDDTPVPRDL